LSNYIQGERKMSEDDVLYAITPRGWLNMEFGEYERPDFLSSDNTVYDRFYDFVKLSAIRDGHKGDTYALVFDEKGGRCVTVGKENG